MGTPSDSTATPPLANPSDDSDQNAIGHRHLLAVAICALGFTFDLSEIALASGLSGVFAAPPNAVSPGELAWLLASTYAGAIVGPPLVGVLADRHGRRLALISTLLLLALGSFAAACSPGMGSLSVARGVSGVALGAYPPLMITYLTDLLPARRRGQLILATVAIAYLGPPATIFLLRALTPAAPFGIAGWRWMLLAGGIGAAIGGALFLLLPEPPRWLRAAARCEVGLDRRRFLLVAALSFLSPWATVAFPLLTGAIMVDRGFALSQTLLTVGVSTFGPLIGTVLVAPFADRVERRTAMIACALGMIAATIGFWASSSPLWLTLSSLGFNFCVALYLPAITVYTAELFPTNARARTTSGAWSFNRIAAALGPLLLLPLMRREGTAAVFAIFVSTLTAGIVLLVRFGPRGKAGRPVA